MNVILFRTGRDIIIMAFLEIHHESPSIKLYYKDLEFRVLKEEPVP